MTQWDASYQNYSWQMWVGSPFFLPPISTNFDIEPGRGYWIELGADGVMRY